MSPPVFWRQELHSPETDRDPVARVTAGHLNQRRNARHARNRASTATVVSARRMDRVRIARATDRDRAKVRATNFGVGHGMGAGRVAVARIAP